MAISGTLPPTQGLPQPTTQTSSDASNNATVDYDAFLQLLVAQLKYQDPTDPTDSAEFMSQLASFSSVEQQIQTNDKLEVLVQSNLLGQATSLIGKIVTPFGSEIGSVVKSVSINNGQLEALLENGSATIIGNGVNISGVES